MMGNVIVFFAVCLQLATGIKLAIRSLNDVRPQQVISSDMLKTPENVPNTDKLITLTDIKIQTISAARVVGHSFFYFFAPHFMSFDAPIDNFVSTFF